ISTARAAFIANNARVAELADAHGSGPCARKGVGVQLPPRAQQEAAGSQRSRGVRRLLSCFMHRSMHSFQSAGLHTSAVRGRDQGAIRSVATCPETAWGIWCSVSRWLTALADSLGESTVIQVVVARDRK